MVEAIVFEDEDGEVIGAGLNRLRMLAQAPDCPIAVMDSTVPPGAVHAFRNAGEAPVRFLNVHRPALAFQQHLETLDRLIRAGKIRGTKDPRSLIHMSMSAMEYRPDVTVKPPQWVVRGFAFIGRRLGCRLNDGTPADQAA